MTVLSRSKPTLAVRYVSPILLMDLPTSSSFDKKDLLLSKKKMLAELELAGTTTVAIKGKELSKNDILQLFDQMGDHAELPYHAAIASDKALLGFLEGGNLARPLGDFSNNPLYDDPQFINWISPYFYQVFTVFVIKYINEKDIDAVADLMQVRMLMNHKYEEMAWVRIEGAIEKHIAEMKALHGDAQARNGYDFVEKVEILCDHHMVNIVLALPEERFATLRDDYAFTMMQLLILAFNTRNLENQRYAKETLLNAKLMASTIYLKEQIQNKYNEMDGLLREAGHTNSDSGGSFPWKTVLAIVIFVIRMATTCNRSDHSISNDYPKTYTPSYYEQPPIVDVDTLFKIPDTFDELASPRLKALAQFVRSVKNGSQTDLSYNQTNSISSGADPYKSIWKNKLFARTGTSLPEHPFQIQNRSDQDGIFFVCNQNKVFSVYVKSQDTVTVQLAENENKIYLYMGNTFKADLKFDLSVDDYKAKEGKGLFTENTHVNNQFLAHPITQIIAKEDGHPKYLVVWSDDRKRISYDHSER